VESTKLNLKLPLKDHGEPPLVISLKYKKDANCKVIFHMSFTNRQPSEKERVESFVNPDRIVIKE
jgi:hypothetical protein